MRICRLRRPQAEVRLDDLPQRQHRLVAGHHQVFVGNDDLKGRLQDRARGRHCGWRVRLHVGERTVELLLADEILDRPTTFPRASSIRCRGMFTLRSINSSGMPPSNDTTSQAWSSFASRSHVCTLMTLVPTGGSPGAPRRVNMMSISLCVCQFPRIDAMSAIRACESLVTVVRSVRL